MAIREIPRAFEYICDGCGAKHRQENAGGHYSDNRPRHWSNIKIERDAYDYQGSAVADASIERLLCLECSKCVVDAVNAAVLSKSENKA